MKKKYLTALVLVVFGLGMFCGAHIWPGGHNAASLLNVPEALAAVSGCSAIQSVECTSAEGKVDLKIYLTGMVTSSNEPLVGREFIKLSVQR